MRPSYFMPNPVEWAAVIADKRRALAEAESAYVRDFVYSSVDWTSASSSAAVGADVDVYLREGTIGDDDQDAALERVLSAMADLRRAELDSRQGRLFPEGFASSRRPIVDPSQVERGNAALERSRKAFTESMRARAEERDSGVRRLRTLHEECERVVEGAIRVGLFGREGAGLYSWGRSSRSREGWTRALMESAELRDAVRGDALRMRAAHDAEAAEREKRREAEARRQKALAAKRPLPKGYTVEKGRGGYQVIAPNGDVLRSIATKGEAVTAAIEHDERKRRK